MRKAVEARLFDLCAAVQEIIDNHEAEALNAAIEEVANRLTTFLEGNRRLGAREKLAYAEALSTRRGSPLCLNPLGRHKAQGRVYWAQHHSPELAAPIPPSTSRSRAAGPVSSTRMPCSRWAASAPAMISPGA